MKIISRTVSRIARIMSRSGSRLEGVWMRQRGWKWKILRRWLMVQTDATLAVLHAATWLNERGL